MNARIAARVFAVVLLTAGSCPNARSQGTAFSYNGHLTANGTSANGTFDFRFVLFTAEAGGSQSGPILTNAPVGVTNGLFTTTLDFGSGVFDGTALWLELAVRPSGTTAPFDPLAPRQPILATPYALYATAAQTATVADTVSWSSVIGLPAGFADAVDNDTTYLAGAGLELVAGTFVLADLGVTSQHLASGAVTVEKLADGATLAELADDDGAGSGLDADSVDGLDSLSLWQLGGNAGSNPGAHFVGTTDKQPLELKVNLQRALRLEDNGDSAADIGTASDGAPNLVAGSSVNMVGAGIVGAVIAGGGATNYGGFAYTNAVLADFGIVGGGFENRIHQDSVGSRIGGGARNQIATNSWYGVIGGGGGNSVGNVSWYSVVSGGSQNRIGTNSTYSSIGGGSRSEVGDNSPYTVIAGGAENIIGAGGNVSTIGGGSENTIGNDSVSTTIAGGALNDAGLNADYGSIGGGFNNDIHAEAGFATIGGGNFNAIGNNSDYGTIGGGDRNGIGDNSQEATVAGGDQNSIGSGARFSAIGGGSLNTIGNNAQHAVIAGGGDNGIGDAASASAIGGGGDNLIGANAAFAAIPGGFDNRVATGASFAFAAGRHARANHTGSFVWADANDLGFGSTVGNGFFVRSVGGVKFVTGIDGTGAETAGLRITGGSSAWSTLSDRSSKENVHAVNPREVLEKLAGIPIATWNWKAQDRSIRHMGPMAQVFHAAFQLGDDDRHICTVDADGVALAAIQGLNQKLREELADRDRKIAELRRGLEGLERLVEQLSTKGD